jgi:hypothetical protein
MIRMIGERTGSYVEARGGGLFYYLSFGLKA